MQLRDIRAVVVLGLIECGRSLERPSVGCSTVTGWGAGLDEDMSDNNPDTRCQTGRRDHDAHRTREPSPTMTPLMRRQRQAKAVPYDLSRAGLPEVSGFSSEDPSLSCHSRSTRPRDIFGVSHCGRGRVLRPTSTDCVGGDLVRNISLTTIWAQADSRADAQTSAVLFRHLKQTVWRNGSSSVVVTRQRVGCWVGSAPTRMPCTRKRRLPRR